MPKGQACEGLSFPGILLDDCWSVSIIDLGLLSPTVEDLGLDRTVPMSRAFCITMPPMDCAGLIHDYGCRPPRRLFLHTLFTGLYGPERRGSARRDGAEDRTDVIELAEFFSLIFYF